MESVRADISQSLLCQHGRDEADGGRQLACDVVCAEYYTKMFLLLFRPLIHFNLFIFPDLELLLLIVLAPMWDADFYNLMWALYLTIVNRR